MCRALGFERCRGCGPYECASVVLTRGRPGLAELGRVSVEGECRGVGKSRKLEVQLKNSALSATKMSVGASKIAQHMREGRQKLSRYQKERKSGRSLRNSS